MLATDVAARGLGKHRASRLDGQGYGARCISVKEKEPQVWQYGLARTNRHYGNIQSQTDI